MLRSRQSRSAMRIAWAIAVVERSAPGRAQRTSPRRVRMHLSSRSPLGPHAASMEDSVASERVLAQRLACATDCIRSDLYILAAHALLGALFGALSPLAQRDRTTHIGTEPPQLVRLDAALQIFRSLDQRAQLGDVLHAAPVSTSAVLVGARGRVPLAVRL